MDSTRQQKYARLIQKDLGEIFQRDVKNLLGGNFITVTTVRVSPDLGIAKVYLSFLNSKEKERILESINKQTKQIRNQLAERIRNQARIIPHLQFYLDDNVEYAANIDQILSKIDIPPAPEEKDGEEDTED